MNSILDSHWYRLTHSVIVFGMAGLVFYAGIVLGGFALRYGMQLIGVQRGIGL